MKVYLDLGHISRSIIWMLMTTKIKCLAAHRNLDPTDWGGQSSSGEHRKKRSPFLLTDFLAQITSSSSNTPSHVFTRDPGLPVQLSGGSPEFWLWSPPKRLFVCAALSCVNSVEMIKNSQRMDEFFRKQSGEFVPRLCVGSLLKSTRTTDVVPS